VCYNYGTHILFLFFVQLIVNVRQENRTKSTLHHNNQLLCIKIHETILSLGLGEKQVTASKIIEVVSEKQQTSGMSDVLW
jgi:hypothetical protein